MFFNDFALYGFYRCLQMDISRLARENELMKDYIHVNEILIDMILENRRAMAILNHYELPDFEKE
jgi:hypothetical protein